MLSLIVKLYIPQSALATAVVPLAILILQEKVVPVELIVREPSTKTLSVALATRYSLTHNSMPIRIIGIDSGI